MTMNLHIYKKTAYTLLLLLLHAACTSEDVMTENGESEYNSQDIVFAAPTIQMDATETRATLLNSFPAKTAFGVLGYCVPRQPGNNNPDWQGGNANWVAKKGLVCADVMYKEPVFYDGKQCFYSNDGTQFNTPKHWYNRQDVGISTINPSLFLYSFIAYYPYTAQFTFNPSSATTIGAPKVTYTMPYNGTNITTRRDPSLVQDVMVASVFDHASAAGSVPLRFKHLTTGLRLQINNYNQPDQNNPGSKDIIINSLSIRGEFYKTGTIDFSFADPKMTVGDDTYSGTFHFIESSAPQTVPANSSAKVPSDDAPTTLLLLPKLDASAGGSESVPYLGRNKTISIGYTYNGNSRTATIENFSLGRTPNQGTCYVLNLNFIGDDLLLMFTADGIEYWEEGSDNDIIIQ